MDDYPFRPCVGSGFCCLKAQCVDSVKVHGPQKRCPSLEWDGQRYQCGLMLLPDPEGEQYRKNLFAGEGCCMPLFNTWRQDVQFRG
jgi:hypothetical protein